MDEGRALVTDLSLEDIHQGAMDLQKVFELVDGEGEYTHEPLYLRGIRKEYKDFLWKMTPKGRTISFTLNILIGRVKAAHDQKHLCKRK